MDNQSHIYDVSFVSSKGSKVKNPQIVFSISEQHLELLRGKVRLITERTEKYVTEYMGTPVVFALPDNDLFGDYVFGYGGCGYMSTKEGHTLFHFELNGKARTNYISITIWILLRVLSNILIDEEIQPSNRWQFIQIETACQRDMSGHAMGGRISTDFGAWLKKQGESIIEPKPFEVLTLPLVEEAMCEVWCKITGHELGKYGKECRAIIMPDGRFSLSCPGNACDVSIYPEGLYEEMGKYTVRFDSHNLDSSTQQITLLAGLASLCDLVKSEIE